LLLYIFEHKLGIQGIILTLREQALRIFTKTLKFSILIIGKKFRFSALLLLQYTNMYFDIFEYFLENPLQINLLTLTSAADKSIYRSIPNPSQYLIYPAISIYE